MPRATSRLSSPAIANIWARRLVEMKDPSTFQPSRLELNVSSSLCISALVDRLPDAPLSDLLVEKLIQLNMLPNPGIQPTSVSLSAAQNCLHLWIVSIFEKKKFALGQSILTRLEIPVLQYSAVDKVSAFQRERYESPALSEMLGSLVDKYQHNYLSMSSGVVSREHTLNLFRFLVLAYESNRLEDIIDELGSSQWIRLCENFLDKDYLLPVGQSEGWLRASLRHTKLETQVQTSPAPPRGEVRRF